MKLDQDPVRESAQAVKPPAIVRLVLSTGDLDGPLNLSMYNLIREALGVAARILEKGGAVGIETLATRDAAAEYRAVRSATDLDSWRDQVNRVVFLSHPVPVIRSLTPTSALQGAGSGRFA